MRFAIIVLLFLTVPFTGLRSEIRKDRVQDFYIELGVGYPVYLGHSDKTEKLLDQYHWESSFKFALFSGIYFPLHERWILGGELGGFSHRFQHQTVSDQILVFNHYLILFSSKYFFGTIGDGFYISDRIGFGFPQFIRDDGNGESVGALKAGFTFGGGIGYAWKLDAFSLTFNFYFLWDSIWAESEDGYPLDTKGIYGWIGVLL
jgi:hypothetical protein